MKTNASITLFVNTPDGNYERYYISNVSWNHKLTHVIDERGLSNVQEFSVRIPMDSLKAAGLSALKPKADDWIVRGNVPSSTTLTVATEAADAFQIRAAVDNRDPRVSEALWHWRLIG